MSEIETRKRRWYQFRLRTLILAITLSAVALSGVQVIGSYVGPPALYLIVLVAASQTVYLLVLLVVRSKWGYGNGQRVATFGTAILSGCLGAVGALLSPLPLLVLPLLCLIGLVFGFYSFLLVHTGVCLWTGERLDVAQDAAKQLHDGADVGDSECIEMDQRDRHGSRGLEGP